MLVNKKLKQAQRLYEKNQQGRMTFMKNIGDALKEPAQSLAEARLNSTPRKANNWRIRQMCWCGWSMKYS